MSWLDITIVVLILLSVVISIFRGLIREVLSLLAWIVAFYVAFRFTAPGAAYLQPYISIEPVRLGVAFLGIFFITLMLLSVFTFFIGKMVDTAGLSGTDRFLGVIFGLLRGVAIVTVMVVFTRLTPVSGTPAWQESVIIPHLEKTAAWVKQYIPREVTQSFSYSSSSTTIEPGEIEYLEEGTGLNDNQENHQSQEQRQVSNEQ